MRVEGWDRAFVDPIVLPDGRQIKTLRDAATYITSLPKKQQDSEDWQFAVKMLLMVAEKGGDEMFPRGAFMRALNLPEAPKAPRRKAVKKYKVVK